MPALRFANLGPTPGTAEVSVAGNIYTVMADDPSIALVLDLHTYTTNPLSDEYRLRFKRIGSFEIPILPKSLLKPAKKLSEQQRNDLPFKAILETVQQVYVVNLTGQAPAKIGWHHLRKMFPRARMSNIPLGRTDWLPVAEQPIDQSIIRAVESTGLVERGEKVEIGPFTLFLFRDPKGGPSSILITGESLGRSFNLFFGGNKALREFFCQDLVETEPPKLHFLSVGRWHAFDDTDLQPV